MGNVPERFCVGVDLSGPAAGWFVVIVQCFILQTPKTFFLGMKVMG